jgi:ABC-2 type transport system ATP-binding protein
MSNAIELRDVSYSPSKKFEIRDLALNVPAGSMYGFLGPNGSGKTTTMRMVMGMLRPAAGTIKVLDGYMPEDAPRLLSRIGYVPERLHLYQTLTVDETVRYHAAFYTSCDLDWAHELGDKLNLDPDQRLGSLSKGEMGKLMMLLALAQRPDLLILDEPTDGLDPVVRREVLMAVLEYVSEQNATVFISSHLVHELELICDWVGVMDRGRLVAELPMQSFKNGMKRLRVQNPPALIEDTPFSLLGRESADGAGEVWVVRGWQPAMTQYFEGTEATLREVIDLDLEEGFVELLRTFREDTV